MNFLLLLKACNVFVHRNFIHFLSDPKDILLFLQVFVLIVQKIVIVCVVQQYNYIAVFFFVGLFLC